VDSANNTNNKIITVSFMVSGILIGIVVSVVMTTMAALATGAVGRFLAQDIVLHGVPVAIGIVAFLALQFNRSVLEWAGEVVSEIRRVVWPSRKDTTSMTIMVCVMLIVSGIVFGVLDMASGVVVNWLLKQNLMGIFG
jgi:preprotein translocase subunit SecE